MENCPICLSLLEDNDSNKIVLECDHGYCRGCIKEWFKSKKNCPICRSPSKLFPYIESVGVKYPDIEFSLEDIDDPIVDGIGHISAPTPLSRPLPRPLSRPLPRLTAPIRRRRTDNTLNSTSVEQRSLSSLNTNKDIHRPIVDTLESINTEPNPLPRLTAPIRRRRTDNTLNSTSVDTLESINIEPIPLPNSSSIRGKRRTFEWLSELDNIDMEDGSESYKLNKKLIILNSLDYDPDMSRVESYIIKSRKQEYRDDLKRIRDTFDIDFELAKLRIRKRRIKYEIEKELDLIRKIDNKLPKSK